MQKSLFIFLLFLTTFSYSQNEKGVVINGVTWATCNVGASNPEEYGKYYQWNKGTVNYLYYKDYSVSSYINSTSWLPANNPCPKGWRIPTDAEIKTLLDKKKVTSKWTTLNSIKGRRFTDKISGNSIFLSAAGFRYGKAPLESVGTYGYYWSSTEKDSEGAYGFQFNSDNTYFIGRYKMFGLFVRCVKE